MNAAYAIHEEEIARATAGDPGAYQDAMLAFEDALVEPLPQPARYILEPVESDQDRWRRERIAAVIAMGGEVG